MSQPEVRLPSVGPYYPVIDKISHSSSAHTSVLLFLLPGLWKSVQWALGPLTSDENMYKRSFHFWFLNFPSAVTLLFWARLNNFIFFSGMLQVSALLMCYFSWTQTRPGSGSGRLTALRCSAPHKMGFCSRVTYLGSLGTPRVCYMFNTTSVTPSILERFKSHHVPNSCSWGFVFTSWSKCCLSSSVFLLWTPRDQIFSW